MPAKAKPERREKLKPAEAEQVALRMLVGELVRIVDSINPGALEPTLRVTRVRLQALEAGRAKPAWPGEDLVLRFKVDTIERALGRIPTQS